MRSQDAEAVRKHLSEITEAFDEEASDGFTRRFNVNGEVVEASEYSEYLCKRHKDLKELGPDYVSKRLSVELKKLFGPIRDFGNSDDRTPERDVIRKEITLSDSDVLYIYIETADPGTRIAKVSRIREEVILGGES